MVLRSWSPSHSKKLAFKLASGDILCSIWADYYTGSGFASYVNQCYQQDDNMVLTPIDFYKTKKNYHPPGDVLGKVCVKKSDFLKIEGFDERMDRHGFEDYDFINRLEMMEVKRVLIEDFKYLQHISHSNEERYTLPIVYERIYVSRKNATRRKIINEEDVIAAMTKYNFTVFHAEDYTFLEQVSFFSNAKYVAGIHGAGLANMLFMPPGSTVFELIKRRTNLIRHFNLLLWYMADALGHKYYCQICEPTDISESFVFADIVVDVNLLNKNLELMFTN